MRSRPRSQVAICRRGEGHRRRRRVDGEDVRDGGVDVGQLEKLRDAVWAVHEFGPAQEVPHVRLGQWYWRHVRSPHV